MPAAGSPGPVNWTATASVTATRVPSAAGRAASGVPSGRPGWTRPRAPTPTARRGAVAARRPGRRRAVLGRAVPAGTTLEAGAGTARAQPGPGRQGPVRAAACRQDRGDPGRDGQRREHGHRQDQAGTPWRALPPAVLHGPNRNADRPRVQADRHAGYQTDITRRDNVQLGGAMGTIPARRPGRLAARLAPPGGPVPGLDGEMVGVGVGGLNVNVGRAVGVGAAEVAGCDGDGFALDRVGDGGRRRRRRAAAAGRGRRAGGRLRVDGQSAGRAGAARQRAAGRGARRLARLPGLGGRGRGGRGMCRR